MPKFLVAIEYTRTERVTLDVIEAETEEAAEDIAKAEAFNPGLCTFEPDTVHVLRVDRTGHPHRAR